MTTRKHASFEQIAEEIDARLKGLSVALGDAITDIVDVLNDNRETAILRDHIFEAGHRPIKTYRDSFFHVNNALCDATDQTLNSAKDGTCLGIRPGGARRYAGRIDTGAGFWRDDIRVKLGHGPLLAEIAKEMNT